MSDSFWPRGLQHSRVPCPSPTTGACSNLCPLSQWCHPTISSTVIPFSSHLQSFPASASFPISQFFALGGQSIAVSASALVLPMNIQDWFPSGIDWFDHLAVQGTLKSLLQHHNSKASVLRCSVYYHFLNCFGLVFVSHFLLLCFLPREVPLVFLVKLVWWCEILLTFVCL